MSMSSVPFRARRAIPLIGLRRSGTGSRRILFVVALALAVLLGSASAAFAITQIPVGKAFPANGSTVAVPRPEIGFTFWGSVPGPKRVVLTVNGVVRYDAMTPQGDFRWTPPSDFASGSTVTVRATVYTGEYPSQVNLGFPLTGPFASPWSFQVVASPMAWTGDCVTCHQTYPEAHPVSDCTACHGTTTATDENDGASAHSQSANALYPAGACLGACHEVWQGSPYAHGTWENVFWESPQGSQYYPRSPIGTGEYTCTSCHSAAWPSIERHSAGTLAAQHAGSFESSCADCHSADLMVEHGKYPEGATFKNQCDTCHGNPAAQAAITAGDTSCDACHDLASAHTFHDDIAVSSCTECHSSDVVALHPDTTCAECHAIQPHAGATCTTCHPTMTEPHGAGPFFDAAAYNPNFAGYLSWSWASANIAGTTGSPHGNYATTTNKCAVCHAVHRASADGNVLTAVTDAFAANRTKTCAFCHGATAFSTKSVAVASDGTISPHGSCSRCHVESPHGVGASVYPVLTEHLLNTRADAAIANDLGTGSNGIVTADFDSGSAKGLTLGTGYLCNQCHSSGGAGINTVYAVNEAGATPAQNATTINNTTGHRVTAVATSDWNVDGSKGAYLTGRIAYNDANSCQACHDAKRANGAAAFPHGYVDAAGAYAPKSQAGASLIWLTSASDADAPRTIVPTPGSTSGTADVSVLTGDGTCLKCHISGDGTAGVGQSY